MSETLWDTMAFGRTSILNRGVVPRRSIRFAFPSYNIHQNRSSKDALVSTQPLVVRRGGSDGSGPKNTIVGFVLRVVSGVGDGGLELGVVRAPTSQAHAISGSVRPGLAFPKREASSLCTIGGPGGIAKLVGEDGIDVKLVYLNKASGFGLLPNLGVGS